MGLQKFEKPQAVERLVFQVKPERLAEWLALDHEIWTLGEAHRSPALLRKEIWLNEAVPGEVHCIIFWSDIHLWMSIDPQWLAETEKTFVDRFGGEDFRFVRSDHGDGIQCFKISEFNRT